MKKVLILALLCCSAPVAEAQWTKVLQLPGTRGASAFFFNATEGVIGTGKFNPTGNVKTARIFYTQDGGATWLEAKLPRTQIFGEVTDIYFSNPSDGWATITETRINGWSGVYHSTDRGHSWKLIRTAQYPVGIRATKRGIFFTNHSDPGVINPEAGIVFSSDTGRTWTLIAQSLYPLGIDFIDGANGYVSSGGGGQKPRLITSDSGKTWLSIDVDHEAWSVYGDPVSRNFFLSNEIPIVGVSNILRTAAGGSQETAVKSFNDTLTGGVAGSHVCGAYVYIQGRSFKTDGPHGLVRSANGGTSWKNVGGPTNVEDTRFAVTGRGAVVYAFDSSGGVWKTAQGGDTTLSPSALNFVSIQKPLGIVSARRCDSAYATFRFGYSACDSNRVARVRFPNDALGELSAPVYSNDFAFYSQSHTGSLNILYQPSSERSWKAQVLLTLEQPDGYLEDTLITIDLSGLAPATRSVTFLDTTAPRTLSFDSVSICAGEARKITLANHSCSEIAIDNLVATPPFSLISTVRPFTLSAGDSRSFVVAYTPKTPQSDQGALVALHNNVRDTLKLLGIGYTPSLALSITKPDTVESSLCDSVAFGIQLRNLNCNAFKVLSITTDAPLTSGSVASIDSIHSGETAALHFSFAPAQQGPVTKSVTIKVSYAGSGEYDTTFTIVGNGTNGLPQLAVNGVAGDSVYTFQMGSVSICLDAFDTVLFLSKGCGMTTITSATFGTPGGFSIDRFNITAVPSDRADTMIVRYHPTKSGSDSAQITLETSGGTKTLKFYLQVAGDQGDVLLTANIPQNVRTCDSAAFQIAVTNGLCDSITLVAANITGAASNEYITSATLPIGFRTLAQKNISALFKPKNGGAQVATAVLTFQRADLSTFDKQVDISADAIGSAPILFGLQTVTTMPGNTPEDVVISLSSLNGSPVAVGGLDFDLVMNTDLLTPFAVLGGTVSGWGNLSTQNFTVTNTTTAHVHLALASDAVLQPGSTFSVVCHPSVADTFKTTVETANPVFAPLVANNDCIGTENTHSTGYYAYPYTCSDSTLKDFMKFQTILIDRIAPNPTSGQVIISLDVPPSYTNEATLEVYDALGVELLTKPLAFKTFGKQQVILDLLTTGAEGLRYLVLRTSEGVTTARVMLQK